MPITVVILARIFFAEHTLGSEEFLEAGTVKRITNLLHLWAGIALLTVGAYFFGGIAGGGRVWWRQHSSLFGQATRATKTVSASDDPALSAAKVKVYGVLGQANDATRGDDAVAAASSGSTSLVDHVNAVNAGGIDVGTPNHFLHRRIAVKTFQFFEFEVPAQAARPELQGTFQAVAEQQTSDSPSVEVLLMNGEEFGRLVNHRPVHDALSSSPSRGGEIYWKLKSASGKPQKYYLVFRNSSPEQGPSIVDADFTASFE